MLNIKHVDEDRLPFISNENKVGIADLPYARFERPIVRGAANQFKRWLNDFFISIMTAGFVMSGLILLILITVIVCSSVVNNDNCCESRSFDNDRTFNVYFVKEATQTWSKREFCYIEATARKYPGLNVHLINLIRTSGTQLNVPETRLKIALAAQNVNISTADFSVDKFFNRPELSSVAESLSNRSLLTAAKAYLLWNSPGIAMHPSAYCNLATVNKSLCKKEKRDCKPNKSIVIDPTIDLQATEVHCQAFLGFLLQEISKNAMHLHSLRDALAKFCPRIDKCPEVRVLDLKSRCSVNAFDCPTFYTLRN